MSRVYINMIVQLLYFLSQALTNILTRLFTEVHQTKHHDNSYYTPRSIAHWLLEYKFFFFSLIQYSTFSDSQSSICNTISQFFSIVGEQTVSLVTKHSALCRLVVDPLQTPFFQSNNTICHFIPFPYLMGSMLGSTTGFSR